MAEGSTYVVKLQKPEEYNRWSLYIQGRLSENSDIAVQNIFIKDNKDKGRLRANGIALSIILPTVSKEVGEVISTDLWEPSEVNSALIVWGFLQDRYQIKVKRTRQQAEKELQGLTNKGDTLQDYLDMKFKFDAIIRRNEKDKSGRIEDMDKKRYLIDACNTSKKMEVVLTPLMIDPAMRDIGKLHDTLRSIMEEMEYMNIGKKVGSVNHLDRESILLAQGREEGRREEQRRRSEGQRERTTVCWGCKQDHLNKPCKKVCKRCGRFHGIVPCRLPATIKCRKCSKQGHNSFVCSTL
tara:strand:- start:478 stop:1365 length:888 start_codon:yes stop_codon:yes gene_type:complete